MCADGYLLPNNPHPQLRFRVGGYLGKNSKKRVLHSVGPLIKFHTIMNTSKINLRKQLASAKGLTLENDTNLILAGGATVASAYVTAAVGVAVNSAIVVKGAVIAYYVGLGAVALGVGALAYNAIESDRK